MYKLPILILTLISTVGCTYNGLYVGYKGSLGSSRVNVRVEGGTPHTRYCRGLDNPCCIGGNYLRKRGCKISH